MIRIEFDSAAETLNAYETLLNSGIDLHMVMDESNAAWAVEVSPERFQIAMEILKQHQLIKN